MHELSICGSIADIVGRHAADRRVRTIHVRIGQLRQIVPETLVYCWTLVTAETSLDGSTIDVERVPAELLCRDCGHTTLVGDQLVIACAACGGIAVSVVAGEEFLITSLDLAEV